MVAAALCVGASRRRAAHRQVREIRDGDFIIYTSRSGDQARQFMEDLAKFRVTLEKTARQARARRTRMPTTS